ncbi:MAG TPA: hypothetical protein VGG20_29865 [Thermoanaerobaculia bacterium]
MTRYPVRIMVLSLTLATLAAIPAAAQIIPKGVDYWVTPDNGKTTFKFKEGDVESLCHVKPVVKWDHQVTLHGVHTKGADWDSAVARLTEARFDPAGNASTRVQFKSLALASTKASDTPCGKLNWTARLAKGTQPITAMKITKTANQGGKFFADLALRVEMRATKADTGAYLGSLFYDVKLPDPAGTAWAFSSTHAFQPGIDPVTKDCVDVLRKKLGDFSPDSQHFYYISNLIAHKDCRNKG